MNALLSQPQYWFYLGAFVCVVIAWILQKKIRAMILLRKYKQDIIGRQLPVTREISRTEGRVSYESREWQARLDESVHKPISFGARATVIDIRGTLLIVKPLGNSLYKA
jgi:membrane protein implicated in regulation of membrane protease activity